MKIFQVTIEGTSPLLQHRFAGAGENVIKRTGVPDYEAEVELALYRDDDGIYEPASHIEASLRRAAANFKMPGKRGRSYKMLIASSIEVWPDAIPHKITDWKTDARPVVVQRARVIRYRPRFDQWALDFEIRATDDELPKDVLNQVLTYAGQYVGIGDWRPEKMGKYGKFIVTRFEEV